MTIYEKIKQLADERKIPIREIEKECKLGNGTIKKWDTSIPKADLLYRVAKFFNLHMEYFLED